MTYGAPRTLIFIPTYNERNNVREMIDQVLSLGLDADLLVMDDNSPDGTGEIIDRLAAEMSRLSVIHRGGKLGIGSAHLAGIRWAYDNGYERLITMDCDFTHSPTDVLRLVENSRASDVTVGSRYMQANSLPGWNLMRRSLTTLGHFLTEHLLGIAVDATGALRAYDLTRIPRELFEKVSAEGYAFFFQSMFVLVRNGFTVKEFPIVLPARTYDSSKMTWKEASRSGSQLLALWVASLTSPKRFRVSRTMPSVQSDLVDPQGWDAYWEEKDGPTAVAYDMVAEVYRTSILKRQLERSIFKHFPEGSNLLHAGCGSGQVDMALHHRLAITAIDISSAALRVYRDNNPDASAVRHASILDLPFPSATFDGVYNLGVLEHFTGDEIQKILGEFHRVLKPKGKVLIFWPHARASSVAVLRTAHWFLNEVLKKGTRLHPAEVSLLRSREWVDRLVTSAGFRLTHYSFGPRDFFVQAIVVAEKGSG